MFLSTEKFHIPPRTLAAILSISEFHELQAWQSAFNKSRDLAYQQAQQNARGGV